jgi:hypothetical protein
MSEIFDALRKAQKKQTAKDDERPAMHLPRAWLDEEPASALGPLEAKPRVPQGQDTRNKHAWLSRVRERFSGNGGESHSEELLLVQPGTMVAEQFRLLRTRVEMAGPGTVMITSALDNEGKTSCAINLTRALAMSIGGGVVLIDADLRHPSAAHLLRIWAGRHSCWGIGTIIDDRWRSPAGCIRRPSSSITGLPRFTATHRSAGEGEFAPLRRVDAPPLLRSIIGADAVVTCCWWCVRGHTAPR